MNRAALTWSALGVLNKTRYDAILAIYGDLDQALKHMSEELLSALGCREETVRDTLMRLEELNMENYERQLTTLGIQFLTIEDSAYPSPLRNIPDPPVFLYAKGDLSIADRPSIALVGTRQMNQYGKHVTQIFTPAFVQAQLVTVSGLAEGIDTEAALETLRAGGKHIAVLGQGMMTIPSSKKKLMEEIIQKGGLILSEFPLGQDSGRYTFPARNRIISGLSRVTVVLQAPAKSGALITADFALEQGKDVFVIPGPITDPTYEGSNQWIARGQAKLVATPNDVLQEMGVITPTATESVFTSDDPTEQSVWNQLSSVPQIADDIVLKTGLATSVVSAALTMLELKGAVRSVGAGQWVRA